jgi:hypothetical protein
VPQVLAFQSGCRSPRRSFSSNVRCSFSIVCGSSLSHLKKRSWAFSSYRCISTFDFSYSNFAYPPDQSFGLSLFELARGKNLGEPIVPCSRRVEFRKGILAKGAETGSYAQNNGSIFTHTAQAAIRHEPPHTGTDPVARLRNLSRAVRCPGEPVAGLGAGRMRTTPETP